MAGNGGTGKLDEIMRAGSARWPDFGITLNQLERYAATTALAETAVANAADVFLACACLANVNAAIAALDRTIRQSVPMFLRRIDRDADFAHDVCQLLAERLLRAVPPKLQAYAGAGPLLNWLRVLTIRLAIDAKRAEPPVLNAFAESFAEHVAADGGSPEIDVLKARYGQSLLDAVARGLRALPRRQRAVLRLYLLANLNIDDLGKMYDVHRSTVARWISNAERSVFDAVKSEFRERWGLATAEVASLARLVRSQLPISLEDVL